ncbi:MAG: gamma-glutamyltransferase [Caldithrix sp.]|nr:gamma-glutamyltransferase [Caldithrix sp.]
MVVSVDSLASRAGLKVLQEGGNAIDAAVTVGFTLAVTYPSAGNIGGGGFMVIRTANNSFHAIDYREKAPITSAKDMFLDGAGNVIKNASVNGYLAVGVPGTVMGLWQAHKKFGSLPWDRLVLPAIQLAKNGFKVGPDLAQQLENFSEPLHKSKAVGNVFFENGKTLSTNHKLRQPQLAATLKRIAKNGADGFYKGETARLIADDMIQNGGLISQNDLDEYETVWRNPIYIRYRGYDIYSMPPPSSGGVVLAEILNTAELYPLNQYGHNSAGYVHTLVEIERHAYYDRARYMGDTDFIKFPIKKLISKSYAKIIKAKINPFVAGKSEKFDPIFSPALESEETTHFSIIDKWGNAVSNTYTLNASFGAKVMVRGAGFLLNNEMDDFSIKPGVPNIYGLIGNDANAIAPQKRMLSSMTPVIIQKNDRLFAVLGSPGGSTIITTVAQIIINLIDFEMNIRQAIEAPRFHHQWLPDVVYHEKRGLNMDTIHILKGWGYRLKSRSDLGRVQGIHLDMDEHANILKGWSDPRGSGAVSGN